MNTLGPVQEVNDVVERAIVWRKDNTPITRFELRKAIDKLLIVRGEKINEPIIIELPPS